MTNLQNLTIVINTRNKPRLLAASLNYHASLGFSAKLIVVDASDDEVFEVNKKNIEGVNNNHNISHVKPKDIKQFPSIIYGLSKVNTDYAIVCGDDDFFVPETLEKCLDFLNKNSDYSACMGAALKVSGNWDSVTRKWNILNAYYLLASNRIESEPSARLVAYSNRLVVTSYAVHKTEVIKTAYDIAKNHSFETDNSLPELALNCFMLIKGKLKVIEEPYHIWFSPLGKRNNIGSTLVNGYGGLHWFDKLFSKEYNKYVKNFVSIMSTDLSKAQEINLSLSRDIVLSVWTGLYANMYLRRSKEQLRLYNRKIWGIVSRIEFAQKILSPLLEPEVRAKLSSTLKYSFISKLLKKDIFLPGRIGSHLKLFVKSINYEMCKNYNFKKHTGEY